jgi:leucyl-tRNA synthetase
MTETTRTGTGDQVDSRRVQDGYDHAAIEARWRRQWEIDNLYRVDDDDPRPKFYGLTMFPYPSGILHVGHWWAYTIPDAYARFKRMQGYNVLFPMGFDALGLPAENAAIRNNIHPATWTFDNIEEMSEQYRSMGPMIDWTRKIVTCTPEFYRWNQWLFLRMVERGLAYRAPGSVWWCPKDQTVLANEQVVDGDRCERCGSEVYKRDLEQWYFRITDYADDSWMAWRPWTGPSGSRPCSATGSASRAAPGCRSGWTTGRGWRSSRPGPTRSGAPPSWSWPRSIPSSPGSRPTSSAPRSTPMWTRRADSPKSTG